MSEKAEYWQGRLEGLFQLVEILRGLVEEGIGAKPDDMAKTLVRHIYEELEDVLKQMHESNAITSSQFARATSTVSAGKTAMTSGGGSVSAEVSKSKDLMKELMGATMSPAQAAKAKK